MKTVKNYINILSEQILPTTDKSNKFTLDILIKKLNNINTYASFDKLVFGVLSNTCKTISKHEANFLNEQIHRLQDEKSEKIERLNREIKLLDEYII